MNKKMIFVEVDRVLADLDAALSRIAPEILAEYRGREEEIPDLYNQMDPVSGAVDAYARMDGKHDVFIHTMLSMNSAAARRDKMLWVERHLGLRAKKRLITYGTKGLVIGDYLIEARNENGADQFAGELILFGQEPFKTWGEVCDYLGI